MDESIRVVALIDMDAFYTQVEEREQPHLRGKPLAVVQFTPSTTIVGQSIAVNYPARGFGIKRGMDCTEVAAGVEKGDISKYRDASCEIFKVLVEFSEHIVVEKASVDEAFLDLTEECERELEKRTTDEWIQKLIAESAELLPSTFLVSESDRQQTLDKMSMERVNSLKSWLNTTCRQSRQQLSIAIGATVVERIRKRIKDATQFNCSAGIAHNKILAKLVCARHKPACQTIIVPQNLTTLYAETPIKSVRNLGGKFGGRLMRLFNAQTMADLRHISRDKLLANFHPKNVEWLTRLLEGTNDEPICPNLQPKSLGVSKNFAGANMLTTIMAVRKWIQALSNELSKRLVQDDDKYGRVAQTLVIGFSTGVGEHNVRTLHLPNYTAASIQQTCWNFMKPFNREKDGLTWYPHVGCMYMSASRFETDFETVDEPLNCSGNDDDDDVVFLIEQNLRKQCDGRALESVDEDGGVHNDHQPADEPDNEIVILEVTTSSSSNDDILAANHGRKKNGRRRKQQQNFAINFATIRHRRRSSTRRITEFFRKDFGCVAESSDCCGSDDEIVILEERNSSRDNLLTARQRTDALLVEAEHVDNIAGVRDVENQENAKM
uniref:DNA polymerase eta n=1 Tax=Globodera rostochiensis TaxID=31243 RepID=A0A914H5B5_GLORO